MITIRFGSGWTMTRKPPTLQTPALNALMLETGNFKLDEDGTYRIQD